MTLDYVYDPHPLDLSYARADFDRCRWCGSWMDGDRCQSGCRECECGDALIDPKSPIDCCKKCTKEAVNA